MRESNLTQSPSHSEVLIIGGGGMGLAAAWHVAKRGHNVRVIERFKFLHNRGSSHTEHRVIRRTYNDDIYSRLVVSAYQGWEELEQESGVKLLNLVGGLDWGPSDDHGLNDIIRVSAALNIPLEVMDANEANKRFPQFHLPDGFTMTLCKLNGFVAVDDAMKAKLDMARKHGAILQDEEQVLQIEPLEHGARVVTDKGTYTCDKLILTAGSYVNPLMQQIGLNFAYTTELNQVHWFAAKDPSLFTMERFPIFIVRWDVGYFNGAYGFPTYRRPGVKVAIHHSNVYIDPEQYDMTPNEGTRDRVTAFVREYMPGLDADSLIDMGTCLYDFPPDEHFVLSKHPQHPDISMANMAGHGYKFAPVVGEILADFAIQGETDYDLTGLGVDRFFNPEAPRRAPIHVDMLRPK